MKEGKKIDTEDCKQCGNVHVCAEIARKGADFDTFEGVDKTYKRVQNECDRYKVNREILPRKEQIPVYRL